MVGEIDEDLDQQLDFRSIRAAPLNPVSFVSVTGDRLPLRQRPRVAVL